MTSSALSVRLLGPISIEQNGERISKLGSQKSIALLGYLACQRQPVSRSTLAALLWLDLPTSNARSNLRWTLNNLVKLLPDCFDSTRQTIEFTPTQDAWIDLYAFSKLAAQEKQDNADLDALARAVDLYRGEFLEGLSLDDCPDFDLWLVQERNALQQQTTRLLHTLVSAHAAGGRYHQAQTFAARLLELEPWNEEAHRWMMQLLAQQGQQGAALAQFEACRQILEQDLDVEPMPETVELYEQILDGHFALPEPLPVPVGAPASPYESPSPRHAWNNIPTTESFYGRAREQAQLVEWLLEERARLVTLLGLGGMGKTALAARVARRVADEFDHVIWGSLLNAPALGDLLRGWVKFLSAQQLNSWPQTLDEQFALLFHHLRDSRCLLLLDNAESILRDGARAGDFRAGYEEYGQLLRRMGESEHQSCLLLTTREKPRDLTRMESSVPAIHTLELEGLDPNAGREILQESNLTGTLGSEVALVMRYSGNPLALRLVADTIQELFDADISAFLGDDAPIFDDVRDVLDEQFARLTRLERHIVLWLAIEREETTMEALLDNLVEHPPKRALLEAIRSLQRRMLIENTEHGFTLQNVVIEYATDYIISHIVEEIETGRVDLLESLALTKALSKAYVRQSQLHHILEPFVERAHGTMGRARFAERLHTILDEQRAAGSQGYAAGNILNLLLHLRIDPRGYDFTRLTIRQAYLREGELPGVDFSGAHFADSVFADTFGLVHSVAFAPDGETMAATAGRDIRFWREPDGQTSIICTGHTDDVWSVAFTPDGEMLISGAWDRTVRLWDARSGRLLSTRIGHEKGVVNVACSTDGNTIASAGYDGRICLWDLDVEEPFHTLDGHEGWVWGVDFSPDGATLASAGGDATVRLWDVESGAERMVLRGHDDQVWSVAFSPDGRLLASGGNDATVRLWDLATGQLLHTMKRHAGWVRDVTFHQDGQLLASSSNDGTVRVWYVGHGETPPHPLQTLHGHLNAVNTVRIGPGGRVIASGSNDQTIRLWDLYTGQTLYVLHGATNWVRAVTFTRDGALLATGGDDGRIRLWNGDLLAAPVDPAPDSERPVERATAAQTERIAVLSGHVQMVRALDFHPQDHLLASASADLTVRLWDVARRQERATLRGHTNWVSSVAFSPDGALLASSSWDETICLWEVPSGVLRRTLRGHERAVYTAVFHPAGELLASGSSDHTIRLWRVDSGEPLGTLRGHDDVVRHLAFSPDGTWLVSGSEDGSVRQWNPDAGQEVGRFLGHTKGIRAVAVSPDGALIASGGDDTTVRLWDVQTGALLHTWTNHSDVVWSVTFSPEGTHVVSGSSDQTVNAWLVRDGRHCGRLSVPGPYEGMEITGVTGITAAQRTMLTTLGAVDRSGCERVFERASET